MKLWAMNLSKFLSAVKTTVHELGYNINQLDIILMHSAGDGIIRVILADKNGEEIKLIIEDNADSM